MNAKEIMEIVKESKLWVSLTEKEKQEAIKYALKSPRLSITEEDIKTTVGEVYLETRNSRRELRR